MVEPPSPPADPGRDPTADEQWVLAAVQHNPICRALLERAGELSLPDWWLAGGAIFQTVWNVLDGRDPTAGIRDYDLVYFDPDDLSAAGEVTAQSRCRARFGDLDGHVEVCNEARVHLRYEREFGVPGRPFTSSRDAIDHFVSTTCCFAVTCGPTGELSLYAPHGCRDLLTRRLVPNPRLDRGETYRRKAERWRREWPDLTVEPWPG